MWEILTMDALFQSVMASTSASFFFFSSVPKCERFRNTCTTIRGCLSVTKVSAAISSSLPSETQGLLTGLTFFFRPGLCSSAASNAAAFSASAATALSASSISNASPAAFVTATSKLFPSPYTSSSLYRTHRDSQSALPIWFLMIVKSLIAPRYCTSANSVSLETDFNRKPGPMSSRPTIVRVPPVLIWCVRERGWFRFKSSGPVPEKGSGGRSVITSGHTIRYTHSRIWVPSCSQHKVRDLNKDAPVRKMDSTPGDGTAAASSSPIARHADGRRRAARLLVRGTSCTALRGAKIESKTGRLVAVKDSNSKIGSHKRSAGTGFPPLVFAAMLRAGTMDLDPIYCAEQIHVPAELAGVLKAFTKEVVRRQPTDVYEFSAIYFANLASVSKSTQETVVPPSVAQLREVYGACKARVEMTLADVMIECTGVGIKLATVEQAFRLGEFGRAEDTAVNPSEPITLLLTMTDASFPGIIASLFEVFGGEDNILTGEEFMSLFKFLVAKDASVKAETVQAMDDELTKLGAITFGAVNNCEPFQKIADGTA